MTPKRIEEIVFFGMFLFYCTTLQAKSKPDIYTLYRDGLLDKSLRIHWATFDNDNEAKDFNKRNCEKVSELYNEYVKGAASIKYWCEKGKFRE